MNKKIVLVVSLIAVILTGVYISNKKQTTVLQYDSITITLNQEFEVEEFEDRPYIIIPINTDLSKMSVLVEDDGVIADALAIHNFLLSVDTYIPKEYKTETEVNDQVIALNIIVR